MRAWLGFGAIGIFCFVLVSAVLGQQRQRFQIPPAVEGVLQEIDRDAGTVTIIDSDDNEKTFTLMQRSRISKQVLADRSRLKSEVAISVTGEEKDGKIQAEQIEIMQPRGQQAVRRQAPQRDQQRPTTRQQPGTSQRPGTGQRPSGMGMGQAFAGRAFFGNIQSTDPLIVESPNGQSREVILSEKTSVIETLMATNRDLKEGQKLSIREFTIPMRDESIVMITILASDE